ncbi:MAG: diaminopimelate epimerase [Clostridiales bacterium]|nr:diaminopimelate epimerase [Clostridiales bacterium]
MRFTKMHGIGNDYIYFDCTPGSGNMIDDPNALSERLADRHFGVGGDGIILIMGSDVADFRMRMFNADGSEGKMCGNGSRCVAKYVYDHGLTDKKDFTLETLAGIRTLSVETGGDGKVEFVTVGMGKPDFKAQNVPVVSDKPEVVDEPCVLAGGLRRVTCVSIGNPHCVYFTENIDSLDLPAIGPLYENDPMFPERVNTEFVEQVAPGHFKMRVWERGSGETFACGTGATAVAASAVRLGLAPAGEFITVSLLGGDLKIMQTEDGEMLMRGPATEVFTGEVDV